MNSIVTVVTPATVTNLTTLERVKRELLITVSTNDEVLLEKIAEASSDIETYLGRVLSRETVSERFFGAPDAGGQIVLGRYPVAAVTSTTIDDEVLDVDDILLDADSGIIHRLDASGYPCRWSWFQGMTLIYSCGYLLPGESGRNLPRVIEAAAVELITMYWRARGRDPMVRAEEIPDVMRKEYWVGAVGDAGELPPSVVSKISRYRRPAL